MNIEDYDRIWSEGTRDEESAREFWDSRAGEFNSLDSKDRFEHVTGLLVRQGLLGPDSDVLDIGCGPGRFSLVLAERARSVTGTDVSGKMIELARGNALAEGRGNVEFLNESWHRTGLDHSGWEGRFDLVFASMCPGINSAGTLLKMCRASRGACYLSTFAERKDPVFEKLCSMLGRNDAVQRWSKNIYAAFNILWLSGYYPEISYQRRKSRRNMTYESALSLYCRYLNIAEDEQEERKAAAAFLESFSESGMVCSETDSLIAMMTWRV